MARSNPDPDALILEAAEGRRPLTDAELRRILEHVAGAGFDPHARERVRGRLAGMTWRGAVLRGRDCLPPAEVKFLSHVVVDREWPDGTDLNVYVRSIRQIILDPSSGVFTSQYSGVWQLGVIRRSGELRGLNGRQWALIEYRLDRSHWVTAFQPRTGLAYLYEPVRSDLRWLRRPSPSSAQPYLSDPFG